MCDKGGECPLQNQAMSTGRGESRFTDTKRTFAKPVALSSEVLLDRERCVSCARCTRFAEQIAGDPLIELLERGPAQQVGIADGVPFDSYFSGNTVQICPVGALTGAAYRFRARPFDLVSTPSVCEHCASGCRQRTDHRRGAVTRRLAGNDPQVNEEWNCDKGRWAFTYATQPDRLVTPLVRDEDGVLGQPPGRRRSRRPPPGWPAPAAGPACSPAGGSPWKTPTPTPSSPGSPWAATTSTCAPARTRRKRRSSSPPTWPAPGSGSATRPGARAGGAAGRVRAGGRVADRLPAAAQGGASRRLTVYSLAPLASPGLAKLSGTLLAARPGAEAEVLNRLGGRRGGLRRGGGRGPAAALNADGAVILAGERLAEVPARCPRGPAGQCHRGQPGLDTAPGRRARRGRGRRPARPAARRAPGHRPGGACRGGPGLGCRRAARRPGPGHRQILAAAAAGDLDALVIAGVDPADLPDPKAALEAIEATPFVVSLELRASAVTDRADVVLPVAAVAEKAGTFVNWEGRPGSFEAALAVPGVQSDLQVLGEIADEMDVHLGLPDAAAARRELGALAGWRGSRAGAPAARLPHDRLPGAGEAILATWHQLLDAGRMQDGEPFLAGTARPAQALMSAATAGEAGTADGDKVTVTTARGAITVGVRIATCPTGWSGCLRTRRAARCAASLVPGTAPW